LKEAHNQLLTYKATFWGEGCIADIIFEDKEHFFSMSFSIPKKMAFLEFMKGLRPNGNIEKTII